MAGESPLYPNAEMEAMIKKMGYGLVKVRNQKPGRTPAWHGCEA